MLARVALGASVAAAVLVVLRPHLVLWLAAASAGVRAGVRFLRPGARHARGPNLMVPLCRRLEEGDGPVRRRHVVISSFDSPGNPHYDGGGAAVVEMIARWLAPDFEVTVVTAGRRGGTVVRNGVRYRQLPATGRARVPGSCCFTCCCRSRPG